MNATRPYRYDQCDGTCTVDCGHCKGKGRPADVAELASRPETDDANEAAVQAARGAYRPAYEQGLASDIASCADWFGWHAAIKAAHAQIEREGLGALRDRLAAHEAFLRDGQERAYLAGDTLKEVELTGERRGVRLALSYVDEALRTAQPAEEAQR